MDSRHGSEPWPRLALVEHWRDVNEHLVELVDLVPSSKIDWSPTPDQWGCRQLYLHIVAARHHWLNVSVIDGDIVPANVQVLHHDATNPEIVDHLRTSWERLERFLGNEDQLNATYQPPPHDPEYLDPEVFDGHFIAFHRLVHDIHHRADIISLLTTLGVDFPADRRRRPL